jgi:hypothetical protein
MTTIEDIILQDDQRGISQLRDHMAPNFVEEAAQLILANPGRVLIVTGFYIAVAGAPETDGPPGAVAMGNALRHMGYDVAYVTDSWSKAAVEAVADGVEVIEFPITNHFESAQFANQLLKDRNPSALISIERAGLVGDGTYRNFRNVDISQYNAKIDHLFDQHPFSIGIGDGGNEIGMGNFQQIIPGMEKLPDNPCVTTTTSLIIASTSNWGGYGLVAQWSLLRNENMLPSVKQGYEWVKRCMDAGAVEGMSGEHKDWVDNRDPEHDAVCLRDLHVLLKTQGL